MWEGGKSILDDGEKGRGKGEAVRCELGRKNWDSDLFFGGMFVGQHHRRVGPYHCPSTHLSSRSEQGEMCIASRVAGPDAHRPEGDS